MDRCKSCGYNGMEKVSRLRASCRNCRWEVDLPPPRTKESFRIVDEDDLVLQENDKVG